VSSDSRGAQPRPIPADEAALARGKNGRRRSIALQGISLGTAAAAAGSAVRAAALSQAASTTSTRTPAATTSASVWPAVRETNLPEHEKKSEGKSQKEKVRRMKWAQIGSLSPIPANPVLLSKKIPFIAHGVTKARRSN
jgi:hypothetical protein